MPRVLITLGDPAGVGPEVVAKALDSGLLPAGFDFQVLGDSRAAVPGKPDARSAQQALDALESSVAILRSDPDAVAVVTAPVSKASLQGAGFAFPGQTEFFAHRFGCEDFTMCLSGATLSVGLVTIHIPLASVSSSLTKGAIMRSGRLLADFARRRFRREPRIAVVGLNPHAGENGLFGNEESLVIAPSIAALSAEQPGVFSGPHVPDAIFRRAADGEFDAVLAMYHDQGLIPLKLLDFDTGVNVTLGLPKPRTSPDHGTAFDIAGKGIARADSMIHAIRLACELA
ncbi:4-hydroxythreonine-4-phosphate dehydrogenase PdxA [Haloferula sp. BvORR071]|uniref:4-hydroxythreonine-4-phosphate dehydrogenase PdxA n=1 Tax=Haloferula sp. BvORR071 TaxID=1396141 RepID=UPI00055511B6|nr:4-hydroxythreonine-4-phosphate dehydrogenase PdxA [Haloferula sp. BvORR071]